MRNHCQHYDYRIGRTEDQDLKLGNSVIKSSHDVQISPDQKFLYVGSSLNQISNKSPFHVAVFDRKGVTGESIECGTGPCEFKFVQANADGPVGDARHDPVISPDGAFVYVSSQFKDLIFVFSRDATTGKLTFTSTAESNRGARHMHLAISDDGDGRFLFSFAGRKRLDSYERNKATGALLLVDTKRENEIEADGDKVVGLNRVGGVAVFGNHVYTASNGGGVVLFALDTSGGGGASQVPNQAPVCLDINIVLTEDTPDTAALSCSDPDTGDTIQIEIVALNLVSVSGPSVGDVGASVSLTPAPNFNGNGGTFDYQAKDSSDATSNVAQATITVLAVNDPPVADAGPDQLNMEWTAGGLSVTLDGSGSSDPDDDTLTYAWSGDLGTASGVGPTVSVPDIGTYNVTLTVDDGNGGSDSDLVNISVVDTTAPVVTAELVPMPGEVEDDEGLFTALFDCSDACDDNPVLTGVISTPSLAGLEVELKTKSKVKVVFDLDKGKVKIEGPDPAALLAQLQQNGGLVIASGQLVHFEVEDDQDKLNFKFDNNGVLKVEGNLAELVAKCEDSSGNIGSDSAVPVFSVDDDSSDDDSGDDDSGDDDSGDNDSGDDDSSDDE